MDTSKEFILMCERAVEIQKLWKVDNGDFMFCKCNNIKYYPKGYELEIITDNHADYHNEDLVASPFDIWLPRQDQLQEMVKLLHDVFTLIKALNLWITYDICFGQSMEQIWLKFIMKHNYNKIWNGNNWII